jgi:[glutamine synthetase] adenylyltransferase / [glutamine synthetase]-adenylyl-L-tyrosine phosphorylase
MSDGRLRSPTARLASAGLDPASASEQLREAGLWSDEGPVPGTGALLDAVADAPDPRDALRVVTDLARDHPKALARLRDVPDWCTRVIAVAGASRPLGELLARDPEALVPLRHPRPVDVATVAHDAEEAVLSEPDDGERATALARIRRHVTARIAARDLTGDADVLDVASDLAALAEGLLAGTLSGITALAGDGGGRQERSGVPSPRTRGARTVGPAGDDGGPVRLCVLGMGKLGGAELNYVSDIDVIFVHEAIDGEEDAARARAQARSSRLMRMLSDSTPVGRAYEVDADLRPEGREGPLSRTVAGFCTYWERWADTWEFQALLKARPVAGDRALGEELLRAAEPFVFPDEPDPEMIAQIREMKDRVEAKEEVRSAGARQLKLGPGGIRDIEFAVQLLQLVHGRAEPSLRVAGTVPALRALADGGYVADDDAEVFTDAYRFLRTIEHRLQLAEERRTHTLPEEPERLDRLARGLGMRPHGDRQPRDDMLDRLRAVQGDVRELYAKLFYRPLLEVHLPVSAEDADLVGPRMDERDAVRRLDALGFRDGAGVLRDVQALTSGVSRHATTLRAVLPPMLHTLVDSPDPDAGVRTFRTLVESQRDANQLVSVLRDQPPAAQLLARLLGTSEVVGELLVGHPGAIQWVTDPDERTEPRSRSELVTAARGLLGWQSGFEDREAALRRFKRRELIRIVVRDLAGDAVSSVTGAELTALGEACLVAGLEAVAESVGRRHGAAARIAVIGLGKLGGRELHYVSDLDVLFVHRALEGADPHEATGYAVAIAERIVDALSAVTREGTAFEVDAELRPEGRRGPLSRSMDSMRTYYERWAETWERQALLKARVVAGDEELGREFTDLAREEAYPTELASQTAVEIRRMKARIERERVPRRGDPKRHVKLGPGGLSDIEWTVQLLQMEHGAKELAVRTTSTMEAVDGLQDVGVIDARDATWLRDGYRFLSEIRNRLYLLRQKDVDVLPSSHLVMEKLARSLGYGRGGAQEAEEDYMRATRRVRQVAERLFYGQET